MFGYSPLPQMKPALYTTLAPMNADNEMEMDKEEDLVYRLFTGGSSAYGYIPFQIEQVRTSQLLRNENSVLSIEKDGSYTILPAE